MARRVILLKPNVANIFLLNFCEQKFVQHGPIKIAIDCNDLSLDQNPHQTVTRSPKNQQYLLQNQIRFGRNTILFIWWDQKDVIYHYFFKSVQTVNIDCYLQQIINFSHDLVVNALYGHYCADVEVG